MTRFLPLAVFAALVGGLFVLPRPDSTHLAATQAGQLLREPGRLTSAGTGEIPDASTELATPGGERAFWNHLLESSVARAKEGGGVELWVRGYRMDLSQATHMDHRLHGRMFESVRRGLRSIAAEHGLELSLKEKSRQDFPGVVFYCSTGDGQLSLEALLPDGSSIRASKEWIAPGVLSVVPFLCVIALAMLLRRPLVALAAGVLVGGVLERFLAGGSWMEAVGQGTGRLATRYLPGQLGETARLEIVLFIVSMLAMVGVVTRAGGVRGLMHWLARLTTSARRSQVVTFLMGLVLFFDHYAASILVGTTMRPLSDRFRVAREKLAYLVDSTAAPVAGLSMFSTWIAFEVSTFSIQLPDVGLAASQGYEVFLRTLPYRFYSLLTLVLVGLVILSGRDFGPMLAAERRARRGTVLRQGSRVSSAVGEGLRPASWVALRARTALLPLTVMILTALTAILLRGDVSSNGLLQALLRGVGTQPLMIGALAGCAVAVLLAWAAGLGGGIAGAAWAGVRSALTPLALLYCAWMIGAICYDMGTTAYLSVLLQETINPLLLPILLFLLAGFLSLATGSSWSTMAILLPMVVGLAFEAGASTAIGGEGMLVVAIASVLEGAIFGDHCSPISHTTLMSSIAAQSDHVDHVKTQAPYALVTMAVAMACGYFATLVFEVPPVLCLLLGVVVLAVLVYSRGCRSEGAEPARSRGQERPRTESPRAAA